MIAALLDHLWQSTLFAGCAGLVTLALQNNQARIRYTVWLMASVKFLVPFSILTAVGGALAPSVQTLTMPITELSLVQQSTMPFAAMSPVRLSGTDPLFVLGAIWLAGFSVILLIWFGRWLRVHAILRHAVPLDLPAPILVKSTSAALGPGLFGIFRPVLLLPDGIATRLTKSEMRAVLDHELCHLERNDNLTAAIHMVVEALFWFHPLVWWLGARMIAERERACDEDVVETGNDAGTYADGILKVCRFYAIPPPLAAAILSADLEDRLEGIMAPRARSELNGAQKILLAACVAFALFWPVLTGWTGAMRDEILQATTPVAGDDTTQAALRRYITQIQMGRLAYDATYSHGRVVWAIEAPLNGSLDGDYFREIFTANEPSQPGLEASLRRFILSLKPRGGDSDFNDDTLIRSTPRQLPYLKPAFHNWGALKSLSFVSVDSEGRNIYQAVFTYGRAEWHIAPPLAASNFPPRRHPS